MNFEIATDEDVPQLLALTEMCYRGDFSKTGWTSESDILEGNRTSENLLRHEMSVGKFLNHKDDQGQMIGCIYMQVVPEERKMYVGNLCVYPSLQSQGLGKKLLAAAEDFAKKAGCSKLVMKVITCRKELIKWYERDGFKFIGETSPFFVEHGVGTPKIPLEFGTWEKVLD